MVSIVCILYIFGHVNNMIKRETCDTLTGSTEFDDEKQ